MSKKTISVRVTQRTYEEFEEYRHDQGTETEPLSKADAGRELIESGLENEKQPDTATAGRAPPRSADGHDEDASEPRGLLPTLMSVAGHDLREQINSFGVLIVFAAVSLFAYSYIPLFGPAFIVPAAFFGLLSVTTLFGIGVGFLDRLDPDPTQTGETPSSDEVEQ
jgi:hypothetical protein